MSSPNLVSQVAALLAKNAWVSAMYDAMRPMMPVPESAAQDWLARRN
jgi:hypothetical protein